MLAVQTNNFATNNSMYRIPNRIFVGGIPQSASQVELKDHFSHFGIVKDARIITDPSGVSKGYGFVTYETEDDATKALNVREDELIFKENKLNIGHAYRKKNNTNGNNNGSSNNYNNLAQQHHQISHMNYNQGQQTYQRRQNTNQYQTQQRNHYNHHQQHYRGQNNTAPHYGNYLAEQQYHHHQAPPMYQNYQHDSNMDM